MSSTQLGVQPTGFQSQYQQQLPPPPPPPQPTISATTTGHQRSSSTAMGTSARIPNGMNVYCYHVNNKFV